MRVIQKLMVTTLLLLASLPSLADSGSATLKEREAQAWQRARDGVYKQVNWAPSFAEAQARAHRERKPLFVFVIVGKNGKKNATEC
jgi:hypothetical protein